MNYPIVLPCFSRVLPYWLNKIVNNHCHESRLLSIRPGLPSGEYYPVTGEIEHVNQNRVATTTANGGKTHQSPCRTEAQHPNGEELVRQGFGRADNDNMDSNS